MRHQAPLLTQITKIKTLEIILQGLEAANLSCFPDHLLQTWYLSKPHKHIWVNCCPVWIFTELTQKIWHFDRFTRTSGIFTDLTQKVDAFWYKYIVLLCFIELIHRVLSCLCLCSSCLSCLLCRSIVLIMLRSIMLRSIVLIMLSSHTLVNFSQDETFLGRKSRMTLLISW